MYVHATHTVHAVPDLRIAGGRLGDVFSRKMSITSETFSVIAKGLLPLQNKLAPQLCNLGDWKSPASLANPTQTMIMAFSGSTTECSNF